MEHKLYTKGSVVLKRAISQNVICEKVTFSNCYFCNNIMIMNRHTCKLFKNVLNDVQTKDNWEIITAKRNYFKQLYLDILYVEVLKCKFLSTSQLRLTIKECTIDLSKWYPIQSV